MLRARIIRPSKPNSINRRIKDCVRNYSSSNILENGKNNFMKLNNTYYNLRYIKTIQITEEAMMTIANTKTFGDWGTGDKIIYFKPQSKAYFDLKKYLNNN